MVNVRPYTLSDLDVIRELVLRLHESLLPLDNDLAPGSEIIERHYQHLMATVEDTNGEIFVATTDGQLIGYVCVWGSVKPEDTDEKPDSYSFMAELFVEPAYRSSGVGGQLVGCAESHAAVCGSYKMELHVLAGNTRAIDFYQSLGYEPRILVMRKRFQ